VKRLSFIVLLALAITTTRADLVHLKDGTAIQGTVKKTPEGWQITTTDGKVSNVATDAVKSISFTGRETPQIGSGPDDKLASLRRAVDYLSDAKQIVDRYQRFIEQNPGTQAAEDAKNDLSLWEARLDKNMVKVGPDWVTQEQRLALQEKSVAAADDIRKLIKAGRNNEADALLTKAQQVDPNNASLLFLKGVLQFHKEQFLPARKTFEQANTQLPNYAPTLNNLAIIAIRQNQWPQALAFYDQAMQASPQNKELLDNVAEALYAIPENQRNLPITQKVTKRFGDQDLALAAKLQPQGLFRWGATWVNAQQLEELKKAEREMRDKLDALSADFDATKVHIAKLDRDIEDNERAMRRLQSSSYVYGSDGIPYRTALPSTYYDLERDNDKLKKDRDDQYAKLDDLRQQARNMQKTYPIPKFTGSQKLFDADSAPVALPTMPGTQPATTQPATRPTWKA